MHLSMSEKMGYRQDVPRDLLRYKGLGLMKTKTGAPDRCEFFNTSQDDLLGQHKAGLELPSDMFKDMHPQSRLSGTILRMIRYPPSVQPGEMRTGLLPHTDYGSVTLLANTLGGLQVLEPGKLPSDEGGWRWVRPRPGCLIVNMGDAMVEWTGEVLQSNIHRVNFSPGQQRFVERLSVALLFCPYKEASMQRRVGGKIPTLEDDVRSGLRAAGDMNRMVSSEWELKKALALKECKDIAKSRGGRELVGA